MERRVAGRACSIRNWASGTELQQMNIRDDRDSPAYVLGTPCG